MEKNILTIDDSSSMRKIVRSCLENIEKVNVNVFEAEDGVIALDLVKGGTAFDLFLVDVNMPNMDGITFVRELRKLSDHSKTPVVMLTTESQPEKKAAGQEAGANGWIVKPFDPEQFVKVVTHLTTK